MTIQTQQDKLNGSMEAFARAFSDVIKDTTSHLATKEDIANMATRQDIANMATKQDIANMATKQDIANMATKQDIANMATKQDINGLSDRIDTTNKNMQAQFARQEEKIAEIARKLD